MCVTYRGFHRKLHSFLMPRATKDIKRFNRSAFSGVSVRCESSPRGQSQCTRTANEPKTTPKIDRKVINRRYEWMDATTVVVASVAALLGGIRRAKTPPCSEHISPIRVVSEHRWILCLVLERTTAKTLVYCISNMSSHVSIFNALPVSKIGFDCTQSQE